MTGVRAQAARRPRLIIVTDLDGTLLHSRSYSFDAANPALALVRERGVPLVLCSSKTRAEIEVYRQRLDNAHPFISENGGGIHLPTGYFPARSPGDAGDGSEVIPLGLHYAEIRKRFVALRDRLGIAVRGFGDMTDGDVAALTGLTIEEAHLARQREFAEPFVFPGEIDHRFLTAIERDGLRWTQGRFFHLMGNHDKGKAIEILRGLYTQRDGGVTIVGIGDSLNDLPMLLAADRPVLVRKESGRHDERIDMPTLIRTDGIGPVGWNEAVREVLR